MPGTVGGVSCTFVRTSSATGKRTRLGIWIVPGLTGVGAHRLGVNDGSFEFRLVAYTTNVGVNTWAAAIEALQGQVIAVTDDHGDLYTGLLVERVSNPKKTPAWGAAGLGTSGRRGEISIKGVIT